MSTFSSNLSSPPDREKLVAEVFFGQIQVAELNQEHERIGIEIYPHPDGQPWNFELAGFLMAVQNARTALVGRG